MDYNQTVHLPQTDFPMRAGLPAREPGMLAKCSCAIIQTSCQNQKTAETMFRRFWSY